MGRLLPFQERASYLRGKIFKKAEIARLVIKNRHVIYATLLWLQERALDIG